jgi:hypothetical protein
MRGADAEDQEIFIIFVFYDYRCSNSIPACFCPVRGAVYRPSCACQVGHRFKGLFG